VQIVWGAKCAAAMPQKCIPTIAAPMTPALPIRFQMTVDTAADRRVNASHSAAPEAHIAMRTDAPTIGRSYRMPGYICMAAMPA
jgi:hypothetical protein